MEKDSVSMETQGRVSGAEIKRRAQEARKASEIDAIVDGLYSDNLAVAIQSAWVLTHFRGKQVNYLIPRQRDLMDYVLRTENFSLQRMVLCLIERQGLQEENIDTEFLNYCFSNIGKNDTPAGIRSLCIKLAYQHCGFYPELLSEFYASLEMIHEGHATCVKSLKKKFLDSRKQESQH